MMKLGLRGLFLVAVRSQYLQIASIFTNRKMHSAKFNIWHLRNKPGSEPLPGLFLGSRRNVSLGRHGAMVRTGASQPERSRVLWAEVHVLTVSVWLAPRHSCILTHPQDVHISVTGNWELS